MDWQQAGAAWGSRAVDWAYLMEPYARPANDILFDELGVGPGVRLLDVACGSGYAAWALPMLQTKLAMATNGPISGPQIFAARGLPLRNRCCQKVSGIHAAAAPAMSKPMMMSGITAAHSITKVCATAVNPVGWPAGARSCRPRLPTCPSPRGPP